MEKREKREKMEKRAGSFPTYLGRRKDNPHGIISVSALPTGFSSGTSTTISCGLITVYTTTYCASKSMLSTT
jgi:hypothetical protein